MEKLDEILRTHPDINISLSWLPKTAPFVGFKRARQLALEAIRTAEATAAEEPHTYRKQRVQGRRARQPLSTSGLNVGTNLNVRP
jgi:hypothetical protein